VTSVTVAAALDGLSLACVTGIDMPLGLLGAGWREADRLARRALGRRGVTVFAIPPRPVWECESYAEASRACRDLTGKGFSVQAWGLRRKIAEADAYRRRASSAVPPVRLYAPHRRRPGSGSHQPCPAGRRRRRDRDPLLIAAAADGSELQRREGVVQDVEALLEEGLADNERRQEAEHVAERPAGEHHQAP
jgi:hypothetical protein